MRHLYGLSDDPTVSVTTDPSSAAPIVVSDPVAPLSTTDNHQSEIDGFLLSNPTPGSSDIADFLKLYTAGDERTAVAQALIARGVDIGSVSRALSFLTDSDSTIAGIKKSTVWGVLSLMSAGASAYHGVRRHNGSLLWGTVWGAFGLVAPIITPIASIMQGFARPKKGE